MKKIKAPLQYFSCECIGGKHGKCGVLLVLNLGGMAEINWCKNRKTRAKEGILLERKSIRKLIKFLKKATNDD